MARASTNPPRGSLRRRGRPSHPAGAFRADLLAAASKRLGAADSADFTLREIAQTAGVTPALAHYYFADRSGLLDALIKEQAEPQLEPLLAILRARTPQPAATLTQFVQHYTTLCARHPWLAPSLVQDSAAARALLKRMATTLTEVTRRAQAASQLREDLPADYIAQALLALCSFPFMPMARGSGGLLALAEQSSAAQLTLQHVALLRNGLVPRYSPRQESGS
jgi:AcrR family transcriptional regulator